METVDGVAVRSERIEFDASELIRCGRCGRANAPNRAECMYCGAATTGGGLTADLNLNPVEPWAKAYNVVLLGGSFSGIQEALPFDPETLRLASGSRPPVPLARTQTREAAEALHNRLRSSGLETAVIGDEDLLPAGPPVRLRSLQIQNTYVATVAFNSGERREFPIDSLELIVAGRLFEERSEQTIKKERKGSREMEVRSISKDTGVIDIYFREEPGGFRVLESGFDFSCLGNGKGLLATENMRRLSDSLLSAAPEASSSSDYVSKRALLGRVWPPSVRSHAEGIARSGLGTSLSKAEVTSNDEQFTKYSRLVRRTL